MPAADIGQRQLRKFLSAVYDKDTPAIFLLDLLDLASDQFGIAPQKAPRISFSGANMITIIDHTHQSDAAFPLEMHRLSCRLQIDARTDSYSTVFLCNTQRVLYALEPQSVT